MADHTSAAADVTAAGRTPNPGTFTMEWPPRSGRTAEFPEIDRVAWWPVDVAEGKLVKGQRPFLVRLLQAIGR